MTMAIETTSNNDLSLEAMLMALDPSEAIAPAKAESTAVELSELDKLALELESLDALNLDAKQDKPTPPTLVSTKPVVDDLELTLNKLSENFEDVLPDVNEIKPVEVETAAELEIEVEEPTPEVTKPKRERAASTEPKTRLDLNSLSVEECDKLGVNKEKLLTSYESCPKKAKEKVLNLIQWALRGSELSIYTQICFESLILNNTVTTEVLRISMMSNPTRPYPAATAGTQAGQIMAAFPTMGITDRVGKNMTIIEKSPLVKLFKEHYAK